MFQKKHGLLCWRTPIFPGRHQPSIFGTNELNFRVRDGNGWTLVVINTNYSLATGSHRTASLLYHTCLKNASLFSKFFKKIFPVLQAPKTQPEPGIDSALFLPPQTRTAYLPHAESFAPSGACANRLRRRRKKTAARLGDCFLCWRTPIFPGRHQPSIFGTNELNFRVRDGNGWTLVVINTNYLFVSGSPDSFYILPRLCANCKHFLRDFFKIPKNHKIWELLSPASTAFCGKILTSRRYLPAAWPPSPSAAGRGTVFPAPG